MRKLSENTIKILKTCNLYFSFFTLGMSIAVVGPCLLELEQVINTDQKHIALMYTTRSTCGIIGAICGGFVLDYMKSKMAVMAVINFIVACTIIGIPWSGKFENLLGIMVANGLCLGALELGSNSVCLLLWREKSGPIFQGLHFTFGLGGLVAPLIAAPFLSEYTESDIPSDIHLNETYLNNTSDSLFNGTTVKESRIAYPFSIIGASGILVSVGFAVLTFIAPTEEGTVDKDKREDNKKSLRFMVPVILFNFLLIFVQAGTEIGYGQMLTSYAAKGPLQLSPTTGSYMTSVFWATFTLSRLASVFLAVKFKSLTILVGDIATIAVAALMLLFLMPREWVLWAASGIYGAGVASFYPTAIGWTSEHILVTNKIASIFTVGAATGEMVMPFLISFFIETLPDIFIYVVAASCVIGSCLVFIVYMIFRYDTGSPGEPDTLRMRTISITA